MDLDRDADAPHRPGPEPLWAESWYFDWAAPDCSTGGYVRLGLLPNLGVAWYWACLVGEGRPLVAVVDHHVPLPRPPSLELRGHGLWADHVVEEPITRTSLGCEAFALELGDPAEAYRPEPRGRRLPLGLDLEWEAVAPPHPYPGTTRYEVPCQVHGEVVVGDEVVEVDAPGQRDHSWGERDWWSLAWCWAAGCLDDGTRFHGTDVRVEGLAYAAGYVGHPGGALVPVAEPVVATERLGRHGLPASAELVVGGLRLAVAPVALAPVQLVAADGRVDRFPRALCRFAAADGRRGSGWVEWNQPPAGGGEAGAPR